MKSWLLVWNPKRHKWDDPNFGYNELRADISQAGYAYGKWSCGTNKSICAGDRIYLIRLGVSERGIVASGYAATDVFEGRHWDQKMAVSGKRVRRIYIQYDKILDIDSGEYLPYELLKTIDNCYHWPSQASGVSIPKETAMQLEAQWKAY